MTRRIVPVALVLLALAGPTRAADAGSVRATFVTPKAGGSVYVALYASEGSFPKTTGAFRQARAAVKDGRATVAFEGLPAGTYAIGAFQDVDGNGKLNTLPVGLPTEPYGFSRGARGAFGPPKWAAAAFRVDAAPVEQTVRLK